MINLTEETIRQLSSGAAKLLLARLVAGPAANPGYSARQLSRLERELLNAGVMESPPIVVIDLIKAGIAPGLATEIATFYSSDVVALALRRAQKARPTNTTGYVLSVCRSETKAMARR